jgi:hypothetical protein
MSPHRRIYAGFGVRARRIATRAVQACVLLAVCAILALAGASQAHACSRAQMAFVHPDGITPTNPAVEEIVAALRRGLGLEIDVCSASALSARASTPALLGAFPLGPEATATVTARFPDARLIPLLVASLPLGTTQGVSVFVSPDTVIDQVCSVAPNIKQLKLVHRPDVPGYFFEHLRKAAARCGITVDTTPVDTLADAAQAVERFLRDPGPHAVWFHRGVINLNDDILIPNIVRLSWSQSIPVIAEEADYVKRGILIGFFHDYGSVARSAVELWRGTGTGLAYSADPKRVINRRTAGAIGIQIKPSQEGLYDYVYQ